MAEADGIVAHVLPGVSCIAAADWDGLVAATPDAAGSPFAAHGFLSALEDSGSVGPGTGWAPAHLRIDAAGRPAGLLPAYLKAHSQGEYVFDHGWADAWMRAGRAYYPKLQIATPFTPATGPRLLAADPGTREALAAAAEALVAHHGLSGAHATFLTAADRETLEGRGWLTRRDVQFHWLNEGFAGFDDFLGALSASRRKTLRRERREALGAIDSVRWLSGRDLSEAAWDAFWDFYQDTGARKWGRPYLSRSFFSLVGERMGDRVLLMLAMRSGRAVAGALNFIGDDCLYGRHWGCAEDIPFLHFELCYHQAIDFACQHGLARVEAGAQGAHKLARGYRPVETVSAHFIADPGLRAAVADFLARETALVSREAGLLSQALPFRRG